MPDDTRLTVLTYHAVDERGDVISVRPDRFRAQVRQLAEHGFRGVTLQQAFEHLEQNGTFPANSVVLTFDDGYRSVYENALPVLRETGFRATVFIPTDFVGTSAHDAQGINPHLDRDMMDWDQLQELAGDGIEIGAHARTHPDLTKIHGQELEDELAGCRLELENRIAQPVVSFAYPYGYLDRRVRQAVGRHFRYACTTSLGHCDPKTDPLRIPRIDTYYLGKNTILLKAANGQLGAWCGARQLLRTLRRLV